MSNDRTCRDGGTAFPAAWLHDERLQGMSLRDYFAAKAMQAALAHSASGFSISDWLAINAKLSYEMADAMLKARESQ